MSEAGYEVAHDTSPTNPPWDDFVGAMRLGHYHLQSSLWAQAKATVGWRSVRAIAREGSTIRGGCQLLLRGHPSIGTVAHAPAGPVLCSDDAALLDALLGEVHALARAHGVISLKLQPPADRPDLVAALGARGFAESRFTAASGGTVRVDLRRSPDDLLGAMRSSTRNHIRKAQRRGVVVREGDAADLRVFGELLAQTAARQGFIPLPLRFYERLWELYSPGTRVRLFVSEQEGRPVSAIFTLVHGDTLLYKMGGWSGEHSSAHPNELSHWHAMLWARDRGLRYYDLEGLSAAAAQAIAAGTAQRGDLDGLARFKLGFGGEAVILPPYCDYTYRPMRAAGVRLLARRLGRWQWVTRRALGREEMAARET